MSGQIQDQIDAMFARLELEQIAVFKRKQMARYTELLLEGLKKSRLTGEKTAEGIIWRQIYDALYFLKLKEPAPGASIIDLGSGGGLPGIPIKICRPDTAVHLMDSSRKKAAFLNEATEKLGLQGAYVLWGRAEEYGQNPRYREKCDLVVSKAVAEMAVLAELALPFLKIGGRAILYKGPRGNQEAETAEKAIAVCGGQLTAVWNYELRSGEERALYEITKKNYSPLKYPRRPGKPARNPIK